MYLRVYRDMEMLPLPIDLEFLLSFPQCFEDLEFSFLCCNLGLMVDSHEVIWRIKLGNEAKVPGTVSSKQQGPQC